MKTRVRYERIGGGFLLLAMGVVFALLLRRSFAVPSQPTIQSAARPKSGSELVLVFIGASTCGACQSPEVARALRAIAKDVRTRAAMEGSGFATEGITTDTDLERGIRFLSDMHMFDEIVAGRGWLNSGAMRWIWTSGGRAAEPQVILVRRDLDVQREGITLKSEEVVERVVGSFDLIDRAHTDQAR